MPIFDDSPNPEVLQKLVQPAILLQNMNKQNMNNICKAVRLWYLLRQLYAPDPTFKQDEIIFAELPSLVFKDTADYHQRDLKQSHNDPECLCSKTIPEILFNKTDDNEQWQEWKQSFVSIYQYISNLQNIEDFLAKLDNVRPFDVTGKTIEHDFEELSNRNFVFIKKIKNKKTIIKCETLPQIEIVPPPVNQNVIQNLSYDDLIFTFLSNDQSIIVDNIAKPINEIQRFYLHSAYETPTYKGIKNIIDILKKLKSVWKQNLLIPVKLTYNSAHLRQLGKDFDPDCLIYPFCIYFYEKAFYICGFGQTPDRKELGDCYHYRLDRIKSLEVIEISSDFLPPYLQEFYQQSQKEDNYKAFVLGQITNIQLRLQQAYGFDQYKEKKEMVICFPADFDRAYNADTFRHETFKQTSLDKVEKKIITAMLDPQQKDFLIEKIKILSKDKYSFYTLQYRVKDYTVIRRLRDWNHQVEILLPWSLRKEIKGDSESNCNRYKDDPL